MQLPVYIGYEKFRQVGYVTIASNRIINVDISFTVTDPIGTAERFALYNNYKELFPKTTHSLKRETQFPFSIKKVSKADFAYRNGNLTHEIISNDLLKYFETKFFIKPSFSQRQKIAFNLKKFFWQTQDFKTHIYKYVVASIIGSALTLLITNLTKKPCPDNSNDSETTSPANMSNSNIPLTISTDTQLPQPIHKTTKSLNDASYSDTTKQKTQKK